MVPSLVTFNFGWINMIFVLINRGLSAITDFLLRRWSSDQIILCFCSRALHEHIIVITRALATQSPAENEILRWRLIARGELHKLI